MTRSRKSSSTSLSAHVPCACSSSRPAARPSALRTAKTSLVPRLLQKEEQATHEEIRITRAGVLRVTEAGGQLGASHASRSLRRESRPVCQATQRGPYMTRGRAGAGPAREKSEPRDTRPLTHREGTRATADQAGGLIRRVCCRPPHCFPAAVTLRAVAGGRGGVQEGPPLVQEGPPLVQEGSRKGPGKVLHAPASIARTRVLRRLEA